MRDLPHCRTDCVQFPLVTGNDPANARHCSQVWRTTYSAKPPLHLRRFVRF